MHLDLNYSKLICSLKPGFKLKRKSCPAPSSASAPSPSPLPASALSLAAFPAPSTANGLNHSIAPSLTYRSQMRMLSEAGDRFSSLQALKPEQLAPALTELEPHVLEPHMEAFGKLLLVCSKKLSLPGLSRLLLAVAELSTKEDKLTTRQLLRSDDSSSSCLLFAIKEMVEQAILLIDRNLSLKVVANLVHACELVQPRQFHADIAHTSMRKLLLVLRKNMGTVQVHRARTHTAQDLRTIFQAFTHMKLLNKSYTKRMKQMVICLAEELGDGALVQEFIQSV